MNRLLVYSGRRALGRALDALIPPHCLCCEQPAHPRLGLCAGCYRDLPRHRAACRWCAAPVPAPGFLCPRCQARPPWFSRVIAPWPYAEPLDHCIRGLKYHGQLAAGRMLGELLARARRQHDACVDAVVPLPLHTTRLRERGFNQATEIARPVAARLDLPLRPDWLHRERATPSQSGLDRRRRRRNIRRAFRAATIPSGCRVALVDDVVTTASSVDEAARALRRAGAREVEVWAPARAP
ncbi:MAG: ComF family protein [Ectothiorhodospiraceae bacterium]